MRLILPFRRSFTPLEIGRPPAVVDRYGLVLSAARIRYRFQRNLADPRVWDILVPEGEVDRARDEIDRYLAENPDAFAAPPRRAAPSLEKWSLASGGGVYVALLLLLSHVYLAEPEQARLAEAGVASSRLILDGQVWRAATALFLHADAAHLGGNMAGLFLFGGLAAREAGTGLGWLLILLTGVFGNLLNAYVHGLMAAGPGLEGLLGGFDHRSIGASTAVFGAVGVLGGCRTLTGFGAAPGRFEKIKTLAPLGAALALLAMLGMGDAEDGAVRNVQVDILAHVLGWLVGLGFGLAIRLAKRGGMTMPRRQAPFLFIAAALIALSWGLAWRSS